MVDGEGVLRALGDWLLFHDLRVVQLVCRADVVLSSKLSPVPRGHLLLAYVIIRVELVLLNHDLVAVLCWVRVLLCWLDQSRASPPELLTVFLDLVLSAILHWPLFRVIHVVLLYRAFWLRRLLMIKVLP